MCLQLAHVFTVPAFADRTINNSDEDHGYPCQHVLPHRSLILLHSIRDHKGVLFLGTIHQMMGKVSRTNRVAACLRGVRGECCQPLWLRREEGCDFRGIEGIRGGASHLMALYNSLVAVLQGDVFASLCGSNEVCLMPSPIAEVLLCI